EHLIRHREIIVEEQDKASKMEKMMMKGFAKWASSPAAYKMSTSMARTALKPWTKDEYIENGTGPLKGGTDVRDFPAPEQGTLRSWYKKRSKGDGSHDNS